VGASSRKKNGTQYFFFVTERLTTTDDMVSICRDMAKAIRRYIPERPDGWAAAICPANQMGRPMGVYCTGWAGHPDEWELKKGEERKATDHADWLAFQSRLRATLSTFGTDGQRDSGGDFKVFEYEGLDPKHTVFVYNPEFLTTELVVAVQDILRNGATNRSVDVCPSFGDAFKTLWEGLEVRAHSVIERWDRHEAEQLLGHRLKIPRYIQDDS
jgi:hypothetical protein